MKNIFKKIDFEHARPSFKRFANTLISFRPLRSPYKVKIIGVTGTSGKTTTTTLLYRISMALGYKAGLIGTVENFIGEKKVPDDFFTKGKVSFWEKIFFTESFTTPEVWNLHKLFSHMQDAGCEYVFMEASSIALEEKRMRGFTFAGAIYTNLSHDHLDFHGTMEDYFQAKKRLFSMLPPGAFALSNVDDKYGLRILEGTKARPFLYGYSDVQRPDIWTLDVRIDFHGEIKKKDFSGLDLSFNDIEIRSKLIGKFNAYNLLAAWSTCSLLGFDMEKVKKIIKDIEPPTGRFQHFTSPNGILVIVDYAHKPDALQNVFSTIQEIKPKEAKIISVFGCGGDRDPSKRPVMGKIGASMSDIAIFTSDNPRSENPDTIITQMKTDLSEELLQKVKTIPDRREAIKETVKLAKKGDIILCAGKGHEDYQEIKGEKKHFSDMEEFKKALI